MIILPDSCIRTPDYGSRDIDVSVMKAGQMGYIRDSSIIVLDNPHRDLYVQLNGRCCPGPHGAYNIKIRCQKPGIQYSTTINALKSHDWMPDDSTSFANMRKLLAELVLEENLRQGEISNVLRLDRKMQQAADNGEFELAARIKRRLEKQLREGKQQFRI